MYLKVLRVPCESCRFTVLTVCLPSIPAHPVREVCV